VRHFAGAAPGSHAAKHHSRSVSTVVRSLRTSVLTMEETSTHVRQKSNCDHARESPCSASAHQPPTRTNGAGMGSSDASGQDPGDRTPATEPGDRARRQSPATEPGDSCSTPSVAEQLNRRRLVGDQHIRRRVRDPVEHAAFDHVVGGTGPDRFAWRRADGSADHRGARRLARRPVRAWHRGRWRPSPRRP